MAIKYVFNPFTGKFDAISVIGTLAPSALGIAAGSQAATSGTVVLSNSNGISFGMSDNSQITASFDGLRGISAGTTVATGSQIVLSNANGISFGADGQTITASVVANAQPITVFSQRAEFNTNYTLTAGLMSYQKVSLALPLSASYGLVVADFAGPSTRFGAVSIYVAAYTLSGGTASVIATACGSFSWTSGSATTASSVYGGVSGTRYRSFPWNVSMPAGDYVFAFVASSINAVTCRLFGRQGVNLVGSYAGAENNYFLDGYSTGPVMAIPSSIIATDPGYARTGVSALQQPGFILIGTT